MKFGGDREGGPRVRWSRRQFVRVLAATAGLAGLRSGPARAQPPPETLKLRLAWTGSTCQAPQYVAEELLKLEGFREVEFVDIAERGAVGVARACGCTRRVIKSHPKKIIAQGTDWRFLNELKKELKA